MERIATLQCTALTETHVHFLNAVVHFIFVFAEAYHLRCSSAHKHIVRLVTRKETQFIVSVFHIIFSLSASVIRGFIRGMYAEYHRCSDISSFYKRILNKFDCYMCYDFSRLTIQQKGARITMQRNYLPFTIVPPGCTTLSAHIRSGE